MLAMDLTRDDVPERPRKAARSSAYKLNLWRHARFEANEIVDEATTLLLRHVPASVPALVSTVARCAARLVHVFLCMRALEPLTGGLDMGDLRTAALGIALKFHVDTNYCISDLLHLHEHRVLRRRALVHAEALLLEVNDWSVPA